MECSGDVSENYELMDLSVSERLRAHCSVCVENNPS